MYRSPDELSSFTIRESASLRDAVRAMDAGHNGIVVVVDDDFRLQGILTDGDFRRAVLSGVRLDASILRAMNTKPEILYSHELTKDRVAAAFTSPKATQFPVIDRTRRVVDLIFSHDLTADVPRAQKRQLPSGTRAVIMAGGQGTRLGPFSKVFPKVLMPIGDRPIVAHIMERFASAGCNQFTLSIHHKARMVKLYFDDDDSDHQINFVEEDEPLGTAGALRNLSKEFDRPFFVSNCDILVDIDFAQVYDFHAANNHVLTIVGSMRHHEIPYGVCDIERGGTLRAIREKPAYDVLMNTGVYLLSPDALPVLPSRPHVDMNEFIDALQAAGHHVGVFPISERSWVDIGQLEVYAKSGDRVRHPF
jgi:dTDP-glucose pyrophosphorylase